MGEDTVLTSQHKEGRAPIPQGAGKAAYELLWAEPIAEAARCHAPAPRTRRPSFPGCGRPQCSLETSSPCYVMVEVGSPERVQAPAKSPFHQEGDEGAQEAIGMGGRCGGCYGLLALHKELQGRATDTETSCWARQWSSRRSLSQAPGFGAEEWW